MEQSLMDKLTILADSAKYDVACTSSGASRAARAGSIGISKLGGMFAIYELLPAFLCALIAIVVVSLLTKAPEQEIVDEFEAVSAEMKQK